MELHAPTAHSSARAWKLNRTCIPTRRTLKRKYKRQVRLAARNLLFEKAVSLIPCLNEMKSQGNLIYHRVCLFNKRIVIIWPYLLYCVCSSFAKAKSTWMRVLRSFQFWRTKEEQHFVIFFCYSHPTFSAGFQFAPACTAIIWVGTGFFHIRDPGLLYGKWPSWPIQFSPK